MNRPGWTSRNSDHIEAKDEQGALRAARAYHRPPWYPVAVLADRTESGYVSDREREALKARGHRVFRVHYHRSGYQHVGCKAVEKQRERERAAGRVESRPLFEAVGGVWPNGQTRLDR